MDRNFFIQWDSTNDCNLRCSHCYHGREDEDHKKHSQNLAKLMGFDEVTAMINDLDETTKRWGFKPTFQISGGEPMCRHDLLDILEYTQKLNMHTRILTNGTLITCEKAKDIKKLGVNRLQISVDGNRKTHNEIRGRDYAYDLAIKGIENCNRAGIEVTVSMTAMNSNKDQLEDLIISSINAGAKYVGFQSYVPDANLGIKDPEFVDSKNTYELFKKTRELNRKYGDKIRVLQTEVLWQTMRWDTKLKQEARATKKFLSGCGAGFSGLAVLSDGTVYPCRRLPIVIGSIKEGIANLMLNSEVLKNLRDFDKLKSEGCCEDVYYCRGCRAVAFALTGDYLAKDPMCIKQYVQKEDIEPRVIRR